MCHAFIWHCNDNEVNVIWSVYGRCAKPDWCEKYSLEILWPTLKAHHQVLNNAAFDGVWWWTETPIFWVLDSTCR